MTAFDFDVPGQLKFDSREVTPLELSMCLVVGEMRKASTPEDLAMVETFAETFETCINQARQIYVDTAEELTDHFGHGSLVSWWIEETTDSRSLEVVGIVHQTPNKRTGVLTTHPFVGVVDPTKLPYPVRLIRAGQITP